jgi:hypothetical protein
MEEISSDKVSLDDTNWLNDVKKSRDIVLEILRFGVTQSQIASIIGLLALELEDRDLMLAIRDLIEKPDKKLEEKKKLIITEGEYYE